MRHSTAQRCSGRGGLQPGQPSSAVQTCQFTFRASQHLKHFRAIRCAQAHAAETAAATAGQGPGIELATLRNQERCKGVETISKRSAAFEKRYCQLQAFHREHGHVRVPVAEPSGLGVWLAQQRVAWKGGRLPPSRHHRLAALGVTCDSFQEAWARRFAQLAAFHSEHGHCRVPASPWAAERYPGLRGWLQGQARQWREGTLPDERRRRLQGLGVEPGAPAASWEQRFAELLAFKEEFGHVDVPFQWRGNPGLAAWVTTQRRRYHGTLGAPLSPAQLSSLQSCGFQFDPWDVRWEARCMELEQLAQQGGGKLRRASLPASLNNWLGFQLSQLRRGRLAPDRAARLQELGVVRGGRLLPARKQQEQLALLDALIASLGWPAAYSLLVLAQASVAPSMAADAVGLAGPAAEGDVCGNKQLTSSDGASVVRWYRALAGRKNVSRMLALELQQRGLLEQQGQVVYHRGTPDSAALFPA